MRRQLHDLFWILLTAAAMAVIVAHEARAELSRNYTWVGVAADLPATCEPGVLFNVVDGATVTDCAVGLGANAVVCVCDSAGTGYLALSPDTDTTCNDVGVVCLFAGSASEGGPATTALALDADPADCAGGNVAQAIDAAGALTCPAGFEVEAAVPDDTLVVDSAGRVGVGTASPTVELDVEGDIHIVDATPLVDLYDTDTSGVHRFQSSNSLFIFQVDPGNLDVNSEMQIRLDGNTTPVLALEVGPEVGVNTPSPQNDFHVIAGDTSTAPMVNLEQTSTGDATLAFELTAATSWALGVDNTDADTFKIQDGADGFATGVNLSLTTAGALSVPALVSCDTIDTNGAGLFSCGTDNVLTDEQVQDYIAELITGNTETGISVTYNDAGDDWNFVTDVQTSDIHGNGANCSAGSAPLGVDALGAVEGCFSVTAKSGEAFVDNRVLRANGTTDVQGSGTTLDDSENISGLNNLTLGGDILGDAADYITIGSYYITTASLGTTAGEDLCRNTSTKRIEECGVSSRRFKKDIKPIDPGTSLVVIQHLTPSRYLYVEGDNNYRAVGLIAEDVADAIPTAARYEDGGRLIRNYDDRQVLAHLVGAVQQLKKEIEVLKDRIEELEPKPPARGRVKLRDEGAQMAAEQR